MGEGTEGIAWLATADPEDLQDGAFYLDRSAVTKHISGIFFTEGSYTKNTKAEVQDMVSRLQKAFSSQPDSSDVSSSSAAAATAAAAATTSSSQTRNADAVSSASSVAAATASSSS